MHPLETKGKKEANAPIDKIESLKTVHWLSMDRWNNLPSKRRHTASDGRRFAFVEAYGGWQHVKIC